MQDVIWLRTLTFWYVMNCLGGIFHSPQGASHGGSTSTKYHTQVATI